LISDKQRLVLLFGAGSTVTAGAPNVNEITHHVRALGQKSGVIKAVVDGLEAPRGQNFNFETVIYALEELTDGLVSFAPLARKTTGSGRNPNPQFSPQMQKLQTGDNVTRKSCCFAIRSLEGDSSLMRKTERRA